MEEDLKRSSGSKELSGTSAEHEENNIDEPCSRKSGHLQTSAPIPPLGRKMFQTIFPAFLCIFLFDSPYPVNIFKKTKTRNILKHTRCKNLRTRLNEQRSFKPHLCNATIQTTSSKPLHVHRAVLASCSKYFEEKFYSKLKHEMSSEPMEIRNISPEVLSSIVDYMYDEPITLTEENIQEINKAAEYLQITDLIQTCYEFLTENANWKSRMMHQPSIKPSNVDDFATNADEALNDNVEEVLEDDDYIFALSGERVDQLKLTRPKQQAENEEQDSDEVNQDLPGISTLAAANSEKGSSKVDMESAEDKDENLVENNSTDQESRQHESQAAECDEASWTSTETPLFEPSTLSDSTNVHVGSARDEVNIAGRDVNIQEHESQGAEYNEASSTSTETPLFEPSPTSSDSTNVHVGSARDEVNIAGRDVNIQEDRRSNVIHSVTNHYNYWEIIENRKMSNEDDNKGSTAQRPGTSNVSSFAAASSNTPPDETILQRSPDEDASSSSNGATVSINNRTPSPENSPEDHVVMNETTNESQTTQSSLEMDSGAKSLSVTSSDSSMLSTVPRDMDSKLLSGRKPTLSEVFESSDPALPSDVQEAPSLLENYKILLKDQNYEEGKTMATKITSMIEGNINATAKEVKEFGKKLREKKLFLESIAFFDAAFAMFEKMGKTEENLNLMRICVWEIMKTNIAMIGDDASMKIVVRSYVIPVMREKLRHIEDTSSVSEQFKCLQVCYVLHYIEVSEGWVDEWEEHEKTLRFALMRMKDMFKSDVMSYYLYGTLLHNLGHVCDRTSRFEEAASFYKQAIDAKKAATDFDDEEKKKRRIEKSEKNLKNVQRNMK